MSAWLGRLAQRVEEITGITSVHETHGEGFLAGHAKRRSRELGITPLALAQRLESESPQSEEWQRLIFGLTNGQTSFFRDREQFEVIARILMERAKEHPTEPLRIWSAACSTGEEPYSLAILCREHELIARILATDINGAFLNLARDAVYEEWALRNVGASLRHRFFERMGGRYRVVQSVRELVRFEQYNLARDPPLSSSEGDGCWDLIVCRNVLMYFRRERMAKICRRLTKHLSGTLVLAACESLYGLELPLAPHPLGGRIVYRPGVTPSTRPVPAPEPTPDAPTRLRPKTRPEAGIDPLRREEGRLAKGDRLGSGAGKESIAGLLDQGHIFMKEHRFAEAGETYGRAERIDSLLSEVHLFKGLLFRKQGRWNEAGQAFRQALFLNPSCWRSAYLLAGVHQRLGRRKEAIRERMTTLRILDQHGAAASLLSNPAYADWFCPSEEEVRRAMRI